MRLEVEYVFPIVFFIIVLLTFGLIIFYTINEDNKEIALCEEHNLEFLGYIYDENGNGSDYCGELKNGILVKKYRIINSRYLEE